MRQRQPRDASGSKARRCCHTAACRLPSYQQPLRRVRSPCQDTISAARGFRQKVKMMSPARVLQTLPEQLRGKGASAARQPASPARPRRASAFTRAAHACSAAASYSFMRCSSPCCAMPIQARRTAVALRAQKNAFFAAPDVFFEERQAPERCQFTLRQASIYRKPPQKMPDARGRKISIMRQYSRLKSSAPRPPSLRIRCSS